VSLASHIAAQASIATIAEYLDGLSHEDRLKQLYKLSRKQQRSLFEIAADSAVLTPADFVGEDVADCVEVIHEGWNSLPVPAAHRRFQKRFARPQDRGDELFGFNQAPSSRFVGPGYFVLRTTEGRPDWESRGTQVVDYFQVPDGAVPSHWPKVVPNKKGIQRFIYDGTRDFMRKVSTHVTIGAAYKGEKPLNQWFVLCRVD